MAYNVQDLILSVQDDLKDPAFSPSRITRYLTYGQNLIFNTHMFKFCEKSVVGTLTVNSYAYDQQLDHQATLGGVVVDPSNSGNRFIIDGDSYLDHRSFFERYPDPLSEQAALPSAWSEFGNEIIFNCPADKAYMFRQRYYRMPSALSTGTDVPDVPVAFRELLELYADFRSEKYRGNHDVAGTYKQEFEDGLENMVLRYGEVQQAGPSIVSSDRMRVEL